MDPSVQTVQCLKKHMRWWGRSSNDPHNPKGQAPEPCDGEAAQQNIRHATPYAVRKEGEGRGWRANQGSIINPTRNGGKGGTKHRENSRTRRGGTGHRSVATSAVWRVMKRAGPATRTVPQRRSTDAHHSWMKRGDSITKGDGGTKRPAEWGPGPGPHAQWGPQGRGATTINWGANKVPPRRGYKDPNSESKLRK